MKTNCYSLFDSKAAVYGTPLFAVNDAMAIRSFKRLVNDPNTMVNSSPEDFSLYKIGTFDDAVGVLDGCEPVAIVNASSLVAVVVSPTVVNGGR